MADAIGTRLEGWRLPKLLGIMLFGLMLGRQLSAGGFLENRRQLWWSFGVGLAIGLPFSLAYALQPDLGQTSLPSIVGTFPLAMAYGAGFVLMWSKGKKLLGIFSAPGRMALTNYLMQSLLGIAIFYGIGLGLFASLPPVGIYAVAVGMFTFQILLSNWWLARHEQGPMERLWRLATYRSLPEPKPA